MDKIREKLLKFIRCYHFLSLELPESEVGGNQGKPTTQVSYPLYSIDVYARKFKSADFVFTCPSWSRSSSMDLTCFDFQC